MIISRKTGESATVDAGHNLSVKTNMGRIRISKMGKKENKAIVIARYKCSLSPQRM